MFVTALILVWVLHIHRCDSTTSFSIDTANHQFLLDGQPFTYLAGEIHYFRIPTDKWEDRLKRVRSLGFNAITVPVPWNLHQPNQDSTPDFSGNLDLVKFIRTAEKYGLYTLIQLGPYMSDEWDNGGLPWWLIRNTNIKKYRSSDREFMNEVTQWWDHFLPILQPLLRKNGGPILMAQIEHYYGRTGICDQIYILDLANLARKYFGTDIVLYSVDVPMMPFMQCGIVHGILPTIEMEPNSDANAVAGWFQQQQMIAAGGPRVGSQFLLGSYRLWGDHVDNPYTENIILKTIQAGWNLNASMSFHMTHGGTNFGFWNGNNNPYPVTTSYDSFAPISEGGDTIGIFVGIWNWVNKLPNWSNKPTNIPALPPRTTYDYITVKPTDSLLDFMKTNGLKCWQSTYQPMTAEDILQGYGFVYYQTVISSCGNLNISQFSDDAYVFLNGRLKGIQGPVFLNNVQVSTWKNCQVPFSTTNLNTVTNYQKILNQIQNEQSVKEIHQPAVFHGILDLENDAMDTYIDTRGWGKGFITVNQYNIGRYWPSEGPQQTLFLPSDFLQKGTNNIILYEFSGAGSACKQSSCTLKFSRYPVFTY